MPQKDNLVFLGHVFKLARLESWEHDFKRQNLVFLEHAFGLQGVLKLLEGEIWQPWTLEKINLDDARSKVGKSKSLDDMCANDMRLPVERMLQKDKILTFCSMCLAKEELRLKRKVKFWLSLALEGPKTSKFGHQESSAWLKKTKYCLFLACAQTGETSKLSAPKKKDKNFDFFRHTPSSSRRSKSVASKKKDKISTFLACSKLGDLRNHLRWNLEKPGFRRRWSH